MSTDSRQSADTSATPTRGRWYIVIAAVL
ncbi:MAG: hypothetical protein QOI35_2542, partial [Cryptosporangiaceae bacterium]|nr:hypothetical protein [Cryptosporangiaceae bacterium]